jgi:DNA-binding response OmpR family regulator
MPPVENSLPHGAGSASLRDASLDRPLRGTTSMSGDAQGASVPNPGTGRRILVVEDEMLIGMLLEDMLADLGFEVAGVIPRVNEALAAAQQDNFDLAILDVHLNGQAVFPVADSLIAREVPFVFATGYGERGLPEKYRGRPILQKPFARDDLEKILKTLIG